MSDDGAFLLVCVESVARQANCTLGEAHSAVHRHLATGDYIDYVVGRRVIDAAVADLLTEGSAE